jgi:hypothetical protein
MGAASMPADFRFAASFPAVGWWRAPLPRVDQDQVRPASDHDHIVDELEPIARLPCRFQGGFPLRGRRLGRDQKARRQMEIALAHHDRFEVARLVDRGCARHPGRVDELMPAVTPTTPAVAPLKKRRRDSLPTRDCHMAPSD